MMDMKVGHDVSMHSFVTYLKLLINSESMSIIKQYRV